MPSKKKTIGMAATYEEYNVVAKALEKHNEKFLKDEQVTMSQFVKNLMKAGILVYNKADKNFANIHDYLNSNH